MTVPVPRISATDIMKRAAMPEPDMQVLSQRFDQLMSKDQLSSAVIDAPTTTLPPQITNGIHSIDSAYRVLNQDMYRMVIDAPHMDMQTITAVSIELTLRTAINQTQLTMCSAVAKSGKDGLTTLMKNQ